MEDIQVIGHRNPDTDAICSAIGYAAFLRESRGENAVPERSSSSCHERILCHSKS